MSKLSTIRFNNRYFNNLIISVVTETVFGNIATLIREWCIVSRETTNRYNFRLQFCMRLQNRKLWRDDKKRGENKYWG